MLVRLFVRITSWVLTVRERAAETTGGTAVEYSLLAALIAAVIVVVVAVLGKKVSNSFQSFNGQFTP
jgi:pilus assembly protein Flp/PilA